MTGRLGNHVEASRRGAGGRAVTDGMLVAEGRLQQTRFLPTRVHFLPFPAGLGAAGRRWLASWPSQNGRR
jgi:hypothetical protein